MLPIEATSFGGAAAVTSVDTVPEVIVLKKNAAEMKSSRM